jgi:hypothetical protein
MTIARMFCFASVLAVATVIGTNVSSYGARPCCNWVDGKYINLKTGKEVKPPKGAVAPSAPLDGGVSQAKSKPATPANPYYRLADPYYGYSDPYRGYYDYYAVPSYSPGYTYGYVRPGGWR